MATYNGETYLQAQLDSFLSQRQIPDELVVSDDGSTDQTLAILENFKRIAPFEVVIVHNTGHKGYASNFNNALSHSTGDLIFLSDQDDVWFDAKIATICAIAENTEKMLIMNDCVYTDKDLLSTGLTKLEQIKNAGMSESAFMMGCCSAIKRELLTIVLPIAPSYSAHDKWINIISILLDQKEIVRDVLQYYRRHGDNVSNFSVNSLKPIKKNSLSSQWRSLINHFNYQSQKKSFCDAKLMLNFIQEHKNLFLDHEKSIGKYSQYAIVKKYPFLSFLSFFYSSCEL